MSTGAQAAVTIVNSFKAIQNTRPGRIDLSLAPGIGLPQGADGDSLHQQSVQKIPGHGFVVSGSADQGYLYVTDATTKQVVRILTIPPYGVANPKIITPAQYIKYNHIGGLQLCGDILAFGCEATSDSSNSIVMFTDINTLLSPGASIVPLRIIERTTGSAGAVGMCETADGWMVVVANYDAERLDFYSFSVPDTGSPFLPTPAVFQKAPVSSISSWDATGSWPGGSSSYQNLSLFFDSSIWMIAMHNKGTYLALPAPTEDYGDLWDIQFTTNTKSPEQTIVTLAKKADTHFFCDTGPTARGPSFMFGSGVDRDPSSGSMTLFAVSMHCGHIPTINQFNS